MKQWIIENCFVESGNQISSGCASESWWVKKNRLDIRQAIIDNTIEGYSFSRRVLLFVDGMEYVPCVECGSPVFCRKSIRCIKKSCKYGDHRTAKIKSTKARKFGDPNYNNHKSTAKTKFERYGDANFNNRAAAKITCLDKYGTTYGASEKGRKHISSVRISRFNETLPETIKDILVSKDKLQELYDTLPFNELREKIGVSARCLLDRLIQFGIHTANSPISSIERNLTQFVASLGIDYKSNDRKVIPPKELDIIIPEKKVAFEMDGVYWHSVLKGKDKQYHLGKTKKCEAKEYQLFHIFDSEWNEKKDIWKSVIKNSLGMSDEVLGARKCKIVELSTKKSNMFCSTNHLQGSCQSSINYGLEYKGQLVSIMTFGKSRFSKKYDWELLRFCSKLNYRIQGGASKLLSHFKKHHNGSIISYANRRWSTGHLYEALGFVYSHSTPPNYFYFKNEGLESRHKYQKHKLKNVLSIFNESLSEWDNMKINGYNKIYDCGNKVYCLS